MLVSGTFMKVYQEKHAESGKEKNILPHRNP